MRIGRASADHPSARGRLWATILCAVVLIGLTWYGISRTYPFDNDVSAADAGDDWRDYQLNGQSIVDDGLLLHRIEGPYFQPGGFLYNYFVAAVFRIIGPQSGYVYAAHYVLLAIGSIFLFLWARRNLGMVSAALYLGVTVWLLLLELDVARHKLLSENLLLALYPAALLLTSLAGARRTFAWSFAAGLMTGLVLLTRPNLLPLPLLVAMALIFVADDGASNLRPRLRNAAIYLFGTASGFSLLPLRNLLASGTALAADRYASHLPSGPFRAVLATIIQKLLFCIGIVPRPGDEGGSAIGNPRLLVLSLCGFLAFVILVRLRAIKLDDALAIAVLLSAFVPYALLPALGAYGFRFQSPYAPMLLYLTFRAASTLAAQRRVRIPAATRTTPQKARRPRKGLRH